MADTKKEIQKILCRKTRAAIVPFFTLHNICERSGAPMLAERVAKRISYYPSVSHELSSPSLLNHSEKLGLPGYTPDEF